MPAVRWERKQYKFRDGVTIRVKDLWSNAILSAGVPLSAKTRSKVDSLMARLPDSNKETVRASEVNRIWDEIFDVINKDLN